MTTNLWDHEEPIADLGIDVPRWIDQDISPSTVAAIIQGGCTSGAYMPAVTYHEALTTMDVYGNDIFQYIDDSYGLSEVRVDLSSESWAGLACAFVSLAVELWASSIEEELVEALEELAEVS